jgi:ribonuclease P protein component
MPEVGRLTSTADYRRTYSAGRRASSRAVVVHVNATGESRPARVGVSAASSIGGAVQRNRSKRRLREAVRPIRGLLARGVDVVFVATPNTAVCDFQDLVDSTRESATSAGALRA